MEYLDVEEPYNPVGWMLEGPDPEEESGIKSDFYISVLQRIFVILTLLNCLIVIYVK